jgi:hypothetical protein
VSGPRALSERGLSLLQFQQDLRTLVKAWGTAGKLGAELGCSAASIDNQRKGYQPPTAPMAERLYGPGRSNRLIARGPDGRPVERKWVQEAPVPCGPRIPGAAEPSAGEDLDDTPTGADFDDEPDDVDTGVARILAACGRRAEPALEPEDARETDPDFLDHQLAEAEAPFTRVTDPAPGDFPAEVAQPEECDASSAEGAGSTPALRSISPDVPCGPRIDGEPSSSAPSAADDDAVAAIEAAGAGLRAGDWPPAEVIRPWSKVPDGDFVVIARGKLAGIEAGLVALEARRQALLAEVAQVQADSLEAEQKADALRRTIEIFDGAAPGIRGDSKFGEESDNGDGCAAQAAE